MSKKEKLLQKLLSRPRDFKFVELSVLLQFLGYIELDRGKTSGSRRAFFSESRDHIIRLHKPHKKDILKTYQIDYIIDELKKGGLV